MKRLQELEIGFRTDLRMYTTTVILMEYQHEALYKDEGDVLAYVKLLNPKKVYLNVVPSQERLLRIGIEALGIKIIN